MLFLFFLPRRFGVPSAVLPGLTPGWPTLAYLVYAGTPRTPGPSRAAPMGLTVPVVNLTLPGAPIGY